MWREQGDAFQAPLTPQHQLNRTAEAAVADLSPPSALTQQGSSGQQEAAAQSQAGASGSPPWQANPVAHTQAVAASQLPADLERPNLLSSSSHVQVHPLPTVHVAPPPASLVAVTLQIVC